MHWTKKMRNIAYILDFFPVISETFITNEIIKLNKIGYKVLIFPRENTIGKEYGAVIHHDSRKLMKDVHYFYNIQNRWSKLQLLVYHLFFMINSPVNYFKTFHFSKKYGTKIFKLFIRSILYATKFRRMRIFHIHAHFALDACSLALLISKLTNIPFSFTIHAHDIFVPELADIAVEKFHHAQFVACISEYNKNYILKQFPGINSHKIKIIHCGLDVEKIEPRNENIEVKEKDNYTILSVGRLVGQKGFKHLIRACQILKEKENLQFTCKIIGDGKDRKKLKKIISELNLDETVNLLGSQEQNDVIKNMRNADLFVLPCVRDEDGFMDGIPVALMEAMALRVPVISTRISGIPELVKDGSGILVPPGDAKELAKAIERVMNLPNDKRQQMIESGREEVLKNFNLGNEVSKLAFHMQTK